MAADQGKKTVKVTLVKSVIGTRESHRATVRGLGLRRMHQSSVLEDTPAVSATIRYEFREQLVKLGVIADDALGRRERARGFEPGFCPEPKR